MQNATKYIFSKIEYLRFILIIKYTFFPLRICIKSNYDDLNGIKFNLSLSISIRNKCSTSSLYIFASIFIYNEIENTLFLLESSILLKKCNIAFHNNFQNRYVIGCIHDVYIFITTKNINLVIEMTVLFDIF